jgi:gas vesicle protein
MTRKLDKEHLESIQDLRERFAQNASWLGNVSIERALIKRQAEQLDAQHEELMRQFDEMREQESEVLEKLKERYGDGEININAGTFTPTGQQ